MFVCSMVLLNLLSGTDPTIELKTVKVSSNVYAFVTHDPTRDIVEGNSVAVIGEQYVLLFDTFGDAYTARVMLQELKKITNKPVRYIVNSHWHYDHVMGNYLIKKEYPDAIVIAQVNTQTQMDHYIPKVIRDEPHATQELIRDYEEAVKTGKNSDGVGLTDYERNIRYPQTIQDGKFGIADLSDYKYERPALTFTDSMTIDLGSEEVRLMHFGRAHSPGDIMAYLSKSNLLITGDIVVSPVPYAFGADHAGWLNYLQKIVSVNPYRIIPGHGEVQTDTSYVSDLIALLLQLDKEVSACIAKGMSRDETTKAVSLNNFRAKLAGDDPAKNWAFVNYFLKPGIKSVYNKMTRK